MTDVVRTGRGGEREEKRQSNKLNHRFMGSGPLLCVCVCVCVSGVNREVYRW